MQCTSTSQAGRWPLGRLLARADLLQRDKRTDGPARAVRTADREGRGTRNLLNRCFKVFIMFVFRSAGQGVASKPAPLHPEWRCLRSAGGAKSVLAPAPIREGASAEKATAGDSLGIRVELLGARRQRKPAARSWRRQLSKDAVLMFVHHGETNLKLLGGFLVEQPLRETAHRFSLALR